MAIFEPMSVNIGNLLARRAHINGSIEALFDVAANRRYTYAELNSETNKVASLLVDAGVKKGDRVALLQMNSAEFMTAFFATAKLGAVIVPLNWRLVPDELEFIVGQEIFTCTIKRKHPEIILLVVRRRTTTEQPH